MPFKVFAPGLLTTNDLDSVLFSQMIIRCTSSDRPIYPEEGWHIYETDTKRLKIFRNGQWADDVGTQQDVIAYKTSDESTTSTVDHTDTQLVVPVEAATNYLVECYLATTSSSAGLYTDFDIGVPTDASLFLVTNHPTSGEEGPISKQLVQSGAIAMSGYVSANGTTVQIRGFLRVLDTAGNFSVIWRTLNSGVTVTMKAGSCIRLRKVI